jgi:hypothetical protein
MKNYIRFLGFCGFLGAYTTLALFGAVLFIAEDKVKKAFGLNA